MNIWQKYLKKLTAMLTAFMMLFGTMNVTALADVIGESNVASPQIVVPAAPSDDTAGEPGEGGEETSNTPLTVKLTLGASEDNTALYVQLSSFEGDLAEGDQLALMADGSVQPLAVGQTVTIGMTAELGDEIIRVMRGGVDVTGEYELTLVDVSAEISTFEGNEAPTAYTKLKVFYYLTSPAENTEEPAYTQTVDLKGSYTLADIAKSNAVFKLALATDIGAGDGAWADDEMVKLCGWKTEADDTIHDTNDLPSESSDTDKGWRGGREVHVSYSNIADKIVAGPDGTCTLNLYNVWYRTGTNNYEILYYLNFPDEEQFSMMTFQYALSGPDHLMITQKESNKQSTDTFVIPANFSSQTILDSKSSYQFIGWSLVREAATEVYKAGNRLALSDLPFVRGTDGVMRVELYANWRNLGGIYNITYHFNMDGEQAAAADISSASETETVKVIYRNEGSLKTTKLMDKNDSNQMAKDIKQAESKGRFVFGGWTSNGTGYQPGAAYTGTADVDMYAAWNDAAKSYSIRYVMNHPNSDGLNYQSDLEWKPVTAIRLMKMKEIPGFAEVKTSEYYTFLGWSTEQLALQDTGYTFSANGASTFADNASIIPGIVIGSSTEGSNNLVLYGVWKREEKISKRYINISPGWGGGCYEGPHPAVDPHDTSNYPRVYFTLNEEGKYVATLPGRSTVEAGMVEGGGYMRPEDAEQWNKTIALENQGYLLIGFGTNRQTKTIELGAMFEDPGPNIYCIFQKIITLTADGASSTMNLSYNSTQSPDNFSPDYGYLCKFPDPSISGDTSRVFAGWKCTETGEMYTNLSKTYILHTERNFEAVWEATTVQVTYGLADGTALPTGAALPQNGTVNVNGAVSAALTVPAGYNAAWTAADANGALANGTDAAIAFNAKDKDVTVTVTFAPNVYDYTYSIGNVPAAVATAPAAGSVNYTESVTLNDALTSNVAGYVFTGWTVADTNGVAVEVVNNQFSMPIGGVTITANWNRTVSYALTGAPEGTAIPAAADYAVGDTVTLADALSIDTYNWNGWTVADSNGQTVEVTNGQFVMPETPVTVTGSMSQTFTVAYALTNAPADAAAAPAAVAGYLPEALIAVDTADRVMNGYLWNGWTVTNDATGEIIIPDDNGQFAMPSASVTISGSWTELNVEPLAFTYDGRARTVTMPDAVQGYNVTLQANGGAALPLDEVTFTDAQNTNAIMTVADETGKVIGTADVPVTISARALRMLVTSMAFPYDGTEHSVTWVATDGGAAEGGLAATDRVNATLVNNGRTEAGSQQVDFDQNTTRIVNISDPARDVTANYDISWNAGTLTVGDTGVAYTVNYYYDGALQPALTETGTAALGSAVTGYVAKAGNNMRLDSVEGLPLVVTNNADDNVVNVYYTTRNALTIVEEVETPTAGSQGNTNVGLTVE